jgi:hypothetical protein
MTAVISKQQARRCGNKIYYDRYSKSYIGCGGEGAKGEKGDQGEKGEKGDQGEKGEKGDSAEAVTGLSISETEESTTYSTGSGLSVSQKMISCTDSKYGLSTNTFLPGPSSTALHGKEQLDSVIMLEVPLSIEKNMNIEIDDCENVTLYLPAYFASNKMKNNILIDEINGSQYEIIKVNEICKCSCDNSSTIASELDLAKMNYENGEIIISGSMEVENGLYTLTFNGGTANEYFVESQEYSEDEVEGVSFQIWPTSEETFIEFNKIDLTDKLIINIKSLEDENEMYVITDKQTEMITALNGTYEGIAKSIANITEKLSINIKTLKLYCGSNGDLRGCISMRCVINNEAQIIKDYVVGFIDLDSRDITLINTKSNGSYKGSLSMNFKKISLTLTQPPINTNNENYEISFMDLSKSSNIGYTLDELSNEYNNDETQTEVVQEGECGEPIPEEECAEPIPEEECVEPEPESDLTTEPEQEPEPYLTTEPEPEFVPECE